MSKERRKSKKLNFCIPKIQYGPWLRLALSHDLQGPGAMRMGRHKPNPCIVTWSWGLEQGALSLIDKWLISTGSFHVGETPPRQIKEAWSEVVSVNVGCRMILSWKSDHMEGLNITESPGALS